MDYLAQIKVYYEKHVTPYLGIPNGASPEAIQALETQIGFELPLAYKQYLAWMGNDDDGIFQGIRWFLSNVEENTRYTPSLLKENSINSPLPTHYLTFFGHQGYMYAWFELPKVNGNNSALHPKSLPHPGGRDFQTQTAALTPLPPWVGEGVGGWRAELLRNLTEPSKTDAFTIFLLQNMALFAELLPKTIKNRIEYGGLNNRKFS